ncbi:MAG: hypothetical protein N3I35_18210 [Clostridia bacterium]|nr:hypothetical protein [Clostridia bacterium]
MINVERIIENIVQVLSQKYPAFSFYLHSIPENISGPSFNIYLDTDRSEDNNRFQTNEITSIGIVYYSPAQEQPGDGLSPISVYSGMKNIFRKGYFVVDDRTLKVALIRGGKQNNTIYLIVKFVYSDDRPCNEEANELIGEVNIK